MQWMSEISFIINQLTRARIPSSTATVATIRLAFSRGVGGCITSQWKTSLFPEINTALDQKYCLHWPSEGYSEYGATSYVPRQCVHMKHSILWQYKNSQYCWINWIILSLLRHISGSQLHAYQQCEISNVFLYSRPKINPLLHNFFFCREIIYGVEENHNNNSTNKKINCTGILQFLVAEKGYVAYLQQCAHTEKNWEETDLFHFNSNVYLQDSQRGGTNATIESYLTWFLRKVGSIPTFTDYCYTTRSNR